MNYYMIFTPINIFLTIAFQLMLIGYLDKHKSKNISNFRHMMLMWIITLITILFTFCFARAITHLSWDDFTIVDEINSYHPRGITLRTATLPVIPLIIMLYRWIFFCDYKTKTAQINLSILYLFGYFLMLIRIALSSFL
jgi:hypothetical protein